MKIDSGLGWICESEFYIENSGELIEYPNGILSKTNSGAAIIGYIHNVNDWYCLEMVSTVPQNTSFSCTNNCCGIFNNFKNAVIDGVTWYYSGMYNYNSSYAKDIGYVSGYQYAYDEHSGMSDAEYIQGFLSAANVRVLRDEKKVIEKVYRKTNGVWMEIEPVEV